MKKIQPWGVPPTPLLPKTLTEELGHIAAPSSLREVLGLPSATLAALNGRLWDRIDSIDEDCLQDIVDIIATRMDSLKHLAVRSGQQLLKPVQELPFSTLTRNSVCQYLDQFAALELTFGDILSVPSFSLRSAIEFACIIEAAALESGIHGKRNIEMGSLILHELAAPPPNLHELTTPPQVQTVLHKLAEYAATIADAGRLDKRKVEARQLIGGRIEIPSEFKSFFQTLAAYAGGEQNSETLAGVLPAPPEEWPPEIKQQWLRLGQINVRAIAGDLAKHYSIPELVSRNLAPADDRLREIMAERVFATSRAATLETIGDRYGVTRERVRQLETTALKRLNRFHNVAEFRPVIRRAKTLRERLGVGIPADHVSIDQTLNWAIDDFAFDHSGTSRLVRGLFLWLAGPYKACNDWLVAERHLPKLTMEALLEKQDDHGLISDHAINETLNHFGFKEEHHDAWIYRLQDLKRVDGGLIYLKGSILDKARTLIRYHNKPLTVEEIIKYTGNGSVRSVRQRLIEDPGIWRINKQNEFVIADTPGYDEYTGITDEIIQEIEACGGQAPFDHLVEKLSSVYGVKKISVIAYLNTPMFTKDDNGVVRIRDTSDGIYISTDIKKTAACYHGIDGTWYWRVLVDKDLLRGSGRLVPNAFAQLLGCEIGNKIEVESEFGPITVSWPLASTTGASIGSLRQALDHYGAELGDYLFVMATNPKITFNRLKKMSLQKSVSDLVRLGLLLGCDYPASDSEAIVKIAEALDVSSSSDDEGRMESHRLLQARGEADLARLIKPPTLTVDDYISNIEKLFDRQV